MSDENDELEVIEVEEVEDIKVPKKGNEKEYYRLYYAKNKAKRQVFCEACDKYVYAYKKHCNSRIHNLNALIKNMKLIG